MRLWAVASGAVALLVVAIGTAEWMGWPFLRQPLQSAFTRASGVPVLMGGNFHARLLRRPQLSVGRLQVAAAHGFALPHLMDASDVQLQWRWLDLWRWQRGGTLRVQGLSAAALDAHLVRNAAGLASWQLGVPATPASNTPDAREPLAGLPRFGLLQLQQAHIAVDDAPSQTRLQVDVQSASAAPAQAMAQASAQTPSAAPQAGYQAQVVGRWKALPLQLQVHSVGSLPMFQDALASDSSTSNGAAPVGVPLRVEGVAGAARLLFEGTASALLGERHLQGALRFSGPSLARVGQPLGVTLPDTPPFELRGQLGHQAGMWQLRADSATIGRSALNGEFRFDTRTNPPLLSGRLGGRRLALADLAPAVGASSTPATPATPTAASTPEPQPRRVLPQRSFDLPSLRAMDADVQVAIAELDFGSAALSALRDVKTRVLLKAGVLQLQALQAGVAGGSFTGHTQLDATTEPARWMADLGFNKVDVAGWLQGLRTTDTDTNTGADASPPNRPASARVLKQRRDEARQGGKQPVRAYLTGTLEGRFRVKGRGHSTAAILSTLDGDAQLSLRDGTVSHLITELAGLDVAQALGVFLRKDSPLPLRCARADLQIQNGVLRPRLAVLDNADSTVRIEGQVNLADETLALRATTKPKDFSPLALRSPITVAGTLGAPQVGVDAKRLSGKVLGAIALGAVVAPAAALLALVDRGSDDKDDPCATQPQPPRPAPGR